MSFVDKSKVLLTLKGWNGHMMTYANGYKFHPFYDGNEKGVYINDARNRWQMLCFVHGDYEVIRDYMIEEIDELVICAIDDGKTEVYYDAQARQAHWLAIVQTVGNAFAEEV
jgi:hypothetical protein